MHEALLRNNRRQKPPANALTLLVRLVLILNSFVFNNVNCIQKMGMAMGTHSAPSFSNIFIGEFEGKFVYTSWWFQFMKFWSRYINDVFFIWTGTSQSLKDLIKYLNSVHPTIKIYCTCNIKKCY